MVGLIKVRFYAAARAAAGVAEMEFQSETVAEILGQCSALSPELAKIIPQCSVLVDGVISHDYQILMTPGSQIDVLPKFAGG